MSSGTIARDPPAAALNNVVSAALSHAQSQLQQSTSETEVIYVESDESGSSEEHSRESDDNGDDIFYGTS
jgi:hypothetical protein